MRKRWLERGKSLAIVLLAVSAVFLGAKTGLFDQLVRDISTQSGTESESAPEQQLQTAALPTACTVTEERGMHYGVCDDEAAVGEVYAKVSNILGEALGSAGAAVAVEESEWRDALAGPGVYLDYLYPQPISALSRWLGSELRYDSGEMVRRICMSEGEEGNIRLYYRTQEGQTLRCETAAVFSSLGARVNEYLPNGAQFAFEAGEAGQGLEPCTLLYSGRGQSAALTAVNPVGSGVSAAQLLEVLSINPYSSDSYPEADGTLVFVADNGTARLTPGGLLSFHAYEGQGLRPGADVSDPGAAIEVARALLTELTGASDGLEKLYCTGLHVGEDGVSRTVTFSYYVNGLELCLSPEPAGWVTVGPHGITQAQLLLRRYYDAGEQALLLPERQAAAIARQSGDGAELRLVYTPRGADRLEPDWIIGQGG